MPEHDRNITENEWRQSAVFCRLRPTVTGFLNRRSEVRVLSGAPSLKMSELDTWRTLPSRLRRSTWTGAILDGGRGRLLVRDNSSGFYNRLGRRWPSLSLDRMILEDQIVLVGIPLAAHES